MCNPEPTTLAEYCRESVAASVLSNYQERVIPQGMTDVEAAHATPTAKDSMNQSLLDELQNVGSCAQVPTKSILAEADEIAGTDRSRDYGHPLTNHRRIAEIWNVQLEKKLAAKIEPRDVALMMIGLKLAREVNTPKRDNLVDAAGYVKCLDLMELECYR